MTFQSKAERIKRNKNALAREHSTRATIPDIDGLSQNQTLSSANSAHQITKFSRNLAVFVEKHSTEKKVSQNTCKATK